MPFMQTAPDVAVAAVDERNWFVKYGRRCKCAEVQMWSEPSDYCKPLLMR